jgi:hypothetical protein
VRNARRCARSISSLQSVLPPPSEQGEIHEVGAERGCGVTQCSSCGGYCKKSGCERENLPRYTVGPYKVDYADFQKALELACHYQNRCCDLEEVVEMFCLDAEENKEKP